MTKKCEICDCYCWGKSFALNGYDNLCSSCCSRIARDLGEFSHRYTFLGTELFERVLYANIYILEGRYWGCPEVNGMIVSIQSDSD